MNIYNIMFNYRKWRDDDALAAFTFIWVTLAIAGTAFLAIAILAAQKLGYL